MGPPIDPGCAGVVDTVTLCVLARLVPHVLPAVTEMVPPVEPAVALIDTVVELPLHPEGKVQVYVVAPGTGDML